MKTYSLEELTDNHIGQAGFQKGDTFEYDIQIYLLGQTIKDARKDGIFIQE